jgi:hypothetical protein
MSDGRFTVVTRVYLTPAQRVKLFHMLDEGNLDLDEWLSELVAAQLDALPDPPPELTTARGEHVIDELRRRRAELRRLRPRLNDPHNPPPAFLVQMVADLEAEVKRLEALGEG